MGIYRGPGERGTARHIYLRAVTHIAERRILLGAERRIGEVDCFFSLGADLIGRFAFAGKKEFLDAFGKEGDSLRLARDSESSESREALRRLIGPEAEWDRTTDIGPALRVVGETLAREARANRRFESELLAHKRRFYDGILDRLVRRDGPHAYQAIFRHCIRRLSDVLRQDEESRLEYEALAKTIRFRGYDDMTPISEVDRILLRALSREKMAECHAEIWRYLVADLYILVNSTDAVIEAASACCSDGDIDRVASDVAEGARVLSEADYLHRLGDRPAGLEKTLGPNVLLPGFSGPEISYFPKVLSAQERIIGGFSVLLGIGSG